MESRNLEHVNPICVWCGNKANLRCGSCEDVWYCSKDHKRLHWSEHSWECRLYKIKNSPEAGRYLVASRSMNPGKLVLKEEPFVVGPLGTSDLICLACHTPIYEEDFYKCPDCFWPMCSLKCALSDSHKDECDILAEDELQCGMPKSRGETPRYDLIILIRCLLLKKSNPKFWEMLMSMASHGHKLKEENEPHQIAAVRYLTEVCKVDFDPDTLHYVRGVILANALQIRGPKGNKIRALYPSISFLNHSCLPNIHLSCNQEGVMEAKAAVHIEKEEELCICYIGTDIPVWERQASLSSVHYFDCLCRRCTDPTELGTMFSSPRCPVCKQIIMECSLGKGSIMWTCPKCQSDSSLEEISQEIEEWLFRLEMNDLFGSGTPYKISYALAMVEQHFHIKHYIWLKAGQAALHKLCFNNTFAALKLRKYVWSKILEIYNIIEPGLTRKRGMTFLELGNVTHMMADPVFLEKGEISKLQMESLLRETKLLYEEGCKILRKEPKGTPEHALAHSMDCKSTAISDQLNKK